jgi:transposase-like protein
MMAELGSTVDRSTVLRWVIKMVPLSEKAFCRRKRPVGKIWRGRDLYPGQRRMEVSLRARREGR